MHPTPLPLCYWPSEFVRSNPDLTIYLNSHLCEFTVDMPTHTMQTCLCAHTQTEREDAKHFLSGFRQIPSVTLAKELEDAEFRTPDSPGGNDPDPDDPDDDDGGDDDMPDPDTKDNPLLTLTNAISHLSHATRHRPEDSGAACTKVHEPDTFNGTDPKKLHEFLVQCELNFRDRPQAFRLDLQKAIWQLLQHHLVVFRWQEASATIPILPQALL
ncbi:hypothetical protein ID866_12459 [Astraeus odoratus]|nr:hypothetical protein ID866_12459 [Astraeus odoratus]